MKRKLKLKFTAGCVLVVFVGLLLLCGKADQLGSKGHSEAKPQKHEMVASTDPQQQSRLVSSEPYAQQSNNSTGEKAELKLGDDLTALKLENSVAYFRAVQRTKRAGPPMTLEERKAASLDRIKGRILEKLAAKNQ